MMLRKISLRQTYQLTTSRVVKESGWQLLHYVTRSPTAIFQFFFTTSDVHLLYLTIGSGLLAWSDDWSLISHQQRTAADCAQCLGDS